MGKRERILKDRTAKRQKLIDILRAGGAATTQVTNDNARFKMIFRLGNEVVNASKTHWEAIRPLTMQIGDRWVWKY